MANFLEKLNEANNREDVICVSKVSGYLSILLFQENPSFIVLSELNRKQNKNFY